MFGHLNGPVNISGFNLAVLWCWQVYVSITVDIFIDSRSTGNSMGFIGSAVEIVFYLFSSSLIFYHFFYFITG